MSKHDGRKLIGKLREINDGLRPVKANRSKVATQIGREFRNPAENMPRQVRRIIRGIDAGTPLGPAENPPAQWGRGEPVAGTQLQW